MTIHKKPMLLNVAFSAIFVLLVIWQMPGTIALRHGVLVILLLASIVLNITHQSIVKDALCSMPSRILLALTGWMVLVIVLWGVEPALSWREFTAQWGIPLLCAYCGVVVSGVAVKTQQIDRVLSVVFWAMFLQVLLHDLLNLVFYIQHHDFAFRSAPVLHVAEWLQQLGRSNQANVFEPGLMDKFSYVNNGFAALLVAEIVQRLLKRARLIPINNLLLAIAMLAMLFCSYTLKTRNGNVGLLLLLLMSGALVAARLITPQNRLKAIAAMMAFVLALGTVGFWFFKSDPRWQTLAATVPIALDTQTHKAWLRQGDYPLLPDGQPVNDSNYERLAWAKEGLLLVEEQPLGTGYNRNAFGDGIDRKYQLGGSYRGGHSHSGLIDLAIANGVPGLLLWLGFLFSVVCIGWAAFAGSGIGAGLMVIFLISGFFGRSIVDSNIRDHILQQFMLLVAMFAVIAHAFKAVKDQPHA